MFNCSFLYLISFYWHAPPQPVALSKLKLNIFVHFVICLNAQNLVFKCFGLVIMITVWNSIINRTKTKILKTNTSLNILLANYFFKSDIYCRIVVLQSGKRRYVPSRSRLFDFINFIVLSKMTDVVTSNSDSQLSTRRWKITWSGVRRCSTLGAAACCAIWSPTVCPST